MEGWRGGVVGEGLCGGKACGGHRLAEGEGRRPGGEAADAGGARVGEAETACGRRGGLMGRAVAMGRELG